MFAFRRDRKRTLRFRAARRVVAAAAALALVFLSLLPAAPARAAVAEELASHVVPGLDPENHRGESLRLRHGAPRREHG